MGPTMGVVNFPHVSLPQWTRPDIKSTRNWETKKPMSVGSGPWCNLTVSMMSFHQRHSVKSR